MIVCNGTLFLAFMLIQVEKTFAFDFSWRELIGQGGVCSSVAATAAERL